MSLWLIARVREISGFSDYAIGISSKVIESCLYWPVFFYVEEGLCT